MTDTTKITLSVVAPQRVLDALREDESALFDQEKREWFAVAGENRRALGLHDGPAFLGDANAKWESFIDRDAGQGLKFPDHDLRMPMGPMLFGSDDTDEAGVGASFDVKLPGEG